MSREIRGLFFYADERTEEEGSAWLRLSERDGEWTVAEWRGVSCNVSDDDKEVIDHDPELP